MSNTVLRTNELAIGYRGRGGKPQAVASGLNLHLKPAELVCLVGPNGVGKSTLLRTILRLQKALSGDVFLRDKPLDDYSEKDLARIVSVVLTAPVQVGEMRVEELVGLGRYPFTGLFGAQTARDHIVVDSVIETVGIGNLRGRFVRELSDGERQRVMIARALAQEPRLLVLDEPTAFLDLPSRVNVIKLLRELAHTHQKTVLTSIHDLDLALRSADRVWLMDQDGSVAEGAPEDLVLTGQFGPVFSQAQVRFDTRTGQFNLSSPPERRIVVQAGGLERIWTERALQRSGFEVLTEASSQVPTVEVVKSGPDTLWRLSFAGRTSEHPSIYSLLNALNS